MIATASPTSFASPAYGASRAARPASALTPNSSASNKELRLAAQNLVSSAFLAPALASMHESPLRPNTGPFAASSTEKRFAPLLEQHLADEIVKATNFSLIDRIVDRYSSAANGDNP